MAHKLHLIAAARPNFMKVAPLYHAFKTTSDFIPYIVHTGQHYDRNMSDSFFLDLQLPEPHFNLGIGSGTHAEQTGNTLIAYEKIGSIERPDLVIVVGDVNATLACALAATKLGLPVAHLEAGLRSFDRSMPEEINRLATDAIVDLLWTPSVDADANLIREGVSSSKIERVGNIMIDSLELLREKIEGDSTARDLGVNQEGFVLVTLHRPSNVDSENVLSALVESIVAISDRLKVVFPVHPRTYKRLIEFNLYSRLKQSDIILCEPLAYVKFMNLLFSSRFVLTDSGGVQEESTYLGISCLTLRDNTERPITVTAGTNRLAKIDSLENEVEKILCESSRQPKVIEFWDGRTASRVVSSARKFLASRSDRRLTY